VTTVIVRQRIRTLNRTLPRDSLREMRRTRERWRRACASALVIPSTDQSAASVVLGTDISTLTTEGDSEAAGLRE
jgi:hypothetical protein